jgi:methyltransferase (TIGR00027 family)
MQRNQPAPRSLTALAVIHGLLMCSRNDRLSHLIDPALADLNEYFFHALMKDYPVNKGWMTYRALTLFPYNWQNSFMEWQGAIGVPQHVAMRKLLMEQQVRQAISAGAEQVLIVGAGYDVLAERLHHEYPHINFIELDRGQTRQTKLTLLDSLVKAGKINLGNNLHFIECDLCQQDWHHSLATAGFSKEKKSIAILEGLTMYLSMEQNTALLQTLRDHVLNRESSIILSFNSTNARVLENKYAVSIISGEAQEYFLGELTPEGVLHFAQQLQLSLCGKALSTYFQEKSGNGVVLKNCKAEQAIVENYYLLSTTPPKVLVTKIDDIPDIEIIVPAKKEAVSVCNIM